MTLATPCSKPYHHGDLRQALLDATRDLLVEGGIQAASLRAVARRAGVTNRAPYHHFQDKNSLLAAVAADGFSKLTQQTKEYLEEAGHDPLDRLTSIGLAYIDFAHTHPGEFQVMFCHEVCDPEEHPDRACASESCFDLLLNTIMGNARVPVPEDHLLSLAVSAWSSVHGFATLRLQEHFQNKPEIRVERLAHHLCRRVANGIALEVGLLNAVPGSADRLPAN